MTDPTARPGATVLQGKPMRGRTVALSHVEQGDPSLVPGFFLFHAVYAGSVSADYMLIRARDELEAIQLAIAAGGRFE